MREVAGKPAHQRELDDLAPRYDWEQHGSYLRALVEGIESGRATNIALSGAYGVGKSSILAGLAQRYGSQVAEVSLATVRAQRTLREGEAPRVGIAAPPASTSDLQKEIVKQLLYVIDPAKAPASRFPRASRFRWGRAVGWAFVAGFSAIAIQWLATVLVAFAQGSTELAWRPDVYIPTFIAAGLVVFLLLRITNGRLRISDLTAGPAKLTLASPDDSYIDDYLDEIVYFFQVSKKRIVIFEDLDRFSDVKLFEDLRALNAVLNRAAQLKPAKVNRGRRFWQGVRRRQPGSAVLDIKNPSGGFHDGPIVFVYAVRDSLFATTVSAGPAVEQDAFTRTKFFDLIIPVVPFVTEQNARGALKSELEDLAKDESHTLAASPNDRLRPSGDLVRLIAPYFPDQRQIRNIRNEFTIYRHALLQPNSHPAELNADRLLALIAYKNIEVADFERIRLGQSKLHKVLRLGSALRAENLENTYTQLSHPSEDALRAAARDVAERVWAQAMALDLSIERLLRRNGSAQYVRVALDELSELPTWRQILTGALQIRIANKSMDRDAFERAFDVSLAFADEEILPLDPAERRRLEDTRDELETATWVQLWNAPAYALSSESSAWAKNSTPAATRSFSQIVHEVLGEGLASELIVTGQLTQNFALLSARFDASFLGLEAQNFVTATAEQLGRRPLEPLSTLAIGQILADRGPTILERSGLVNIHVLAYLLESMPTEAHRLLAQLRAFDDKDKAFLRDFLQRYADSPLREAFAEAIGFLVTLSPMVIEFVALDPVVPEGWQDACLDAAISRVHPSELPTPLVRNEAVAAVLQRLHPELASLTHADDHASNAASVLVEFATRIDDVAPLAITARSIFAAAGQFQVTMHNLRVLTDQPDKAWVTLAALRRNSEAYSSTLGRVEEYLAIRSESDTTQQNTANTPQGLTAVLTDLTDLRSDDPALDGLLAEIVQGANPEIAIEDINSLDGPIQEAILAGGRARPSVANLLARFATAGRVTPGMAHFLNLHQRPEIEDQDLSSFATSLLAATTVYPQLLTPDLLSTFFEHAEASISVSDAAILGAAPGVAVRLIGDGWGDTENLRATATHETPWPIREVLLAAEPAPSIATVRALLTSADTQAFMMNESIKPSTRAAALELLDDVLLGPAAASNAREIATFIVRHDVPADITAVHELARHGADRTSLVTLLAREPARNDFAANPVPTLNILGGRYAAIVGSRYVDSPVFPHDDAHNSFLDILASAGVVRRMRPAGTEPFRIQRMRCTD